MGKSYLQVPIVVPKVTEKATFGTTIGSFFFIPLFFMYFVLPLHSN